MTGVNVLEGDTVVVVEVYDDDQLVEVVEQPTNTAVVEVLVYHGPPGADGPPGPPGPGGGTYLAVLGEPVPAMRVVYVTPTGAYSASSADPDTVDLVVGVTRYAGTTDDTVEIVALGVLEPPVDYPLGDLYLGPGGQLTPDPNTGVVCYPIARAVTPRRVTVNLGTPSYT